MQSLMCLALFAGLEYPFGEMPCQARVQLQQAGALTEAQVEGTVAGVTAGHKRLTLVCKALSVLTRPAASAPVPKQSEKELHVFCNPLFGAS